MKKESNQTKFFNHLEKNDCALPHGHKENCVTDTTQNKPNCCEKCVIPKHVESVYICDNRHCECHTTQATSPEIEFATERLAEWKANGMQSISLKEYMDKNNVQTTPSEEWKSEFDEMARALNLREETVSGVDEYSTVKSFIQATRTAAYEKGVRDSLEVVNGTNQWISAGISMSSSEIKNKISDAISTLLK